MSIGSIKKRSVVFPREILKRARLKEGQKVEIQVEAGKITLIPVQQLDQYTKRILARMKKGYHMGKLLVPLTREGIYQ